MAPLPPVDADQVARHADAVRALARRLVCDGATAEDVAQEAWLVALEGARRGDVPLRWWVRGVVRNVARHFRRADATRRRHETRAARPEAMPTAECSVERAEVHRRLVDAVLALDEPYRATVLARYFDELSSAEIARREGVPEGTVRSRLKRGLDMLRARLDAEHAGDRAAWAVLVAPLALGRPGRVAVAAPVVRSGMRVPLAAAALVAAAVGGTWIALARLGPAEGGGAADARADAARAPAPDAQSTGARRRARTDRTANVAATDDAIDAATDASLGVKGVFVRPDGTPVGGVRWRVLRGMHAAAESVATADGTFETRLPASGAAWVVGETDDLRGGALLAAGELVRVKMFGLATWRARIVDGVDEGIPGAAIRTCENGSNGLSPWWTLGVSGADGFAEVRITEPEPLGGGRGFWADGIRVEAAGWSPCQLVAAPRQMPERVILDRLPATRLSRIEGRVVDARGAPVPDARVRSGEVVSVAAGGVFALEVPILPEQAQVPLAVDAPGFCAANVDVAPDNRAVVVQLARPRDVHVVLLRPDGTRADGAHLVLDGTWTVTGGGGDFLLKAVMPGPRRFRAALTPEGAPGGAPELETEVVFDLAEGEGALELPVTLRPAVVSWTRVEVVDDAGAPVAGIHVHDIGLGPIRHVPHTFTDANGRATLAWATPPGVHVEIEASGPGRRSDPVRTTTAGSANAALVRLVLRPLVRIVFDVTGAGDAPLPPETPATLEVELSDAQVDATDRLAVVVSGSESLRVRISAAHHAARHVNCTAPASGTLRVPVRLHRAATVRGRVLAQDGRPFVGADVIAIVPADSDEAYTTTSDDGAFEIGELAPGQIRVVAGRWGDTPEVALDVVLAPGADHDVGDLRLVGLVWMRGRVVDRRGRPVVGASLEPLGLGDDQSAAPGSLSAADGRFEFPLARGAHARLTVAAEGYARATFPIDAGDGRDDLLVELRPEARLRVTLEAPLPSVLMEPLARIETAGGAVEEDPDVTDLRAGSLPGSWACDFELTGLAAGRTRVTVTSGDLRALADVDLREGETATTRLRLTR